MVLRTVDWIVVLELEAGPGDVVELARLDGLLGSLAEFEPSALYSSDRYAVQLVLPVGGPAEAVTMATETVLEAAGRAGLPDCIVRAQAMTPAELATEIATSEGDLPLLVGDPASGDVLPAVHEATRVLVRATTSRQVIDAVVRLVQRLGGRVGPAADSHPGVFQLGVTLLPGEQLAAFADDGDVWIRLAEALPGVLEDATAVLERLQVSA
jgi:hypothetical protein